MIRLNKGSLASHEDPKFPTNLGGLPKHLLIGLELNLKPHTKSYVGRYEPNKVSLQINLERNPTNSLYIFILSENFENLTVKLHVLITSLMLTKF